MMVQHSGTTCNGVRSCSVVRSLIGDCWLFGCTLIWCVGRVQSVTNLFMTQALLPSGNGLTAWQPATSVQNPDCSDAWYRQMWWGCISGRA